MDPIFGVDDVLEEVDEFIDLPYAFSKDGRHTADVERRVCIVNRVNGVLLKRILLKSTCFRVPVSSSTIVYYLYSYIFIAMTLKI